MSSTKRGWGAVISIFILVPILFKLIAKLPVPTLYSGLAQDLLVLLIFLLLNHFWFKISIQWWQSQSLARQCLQLIPGIIITNDKQLHQVTSACLDPNVNSLYRLRPSYRDH